MKPGRELDALVAEKVMGLTVAKDRGDYGIGEKIKFRQGPVCYELENPLPCYSTEIEAAWEVVEKMIANGFEDFNLDASDTGDWYARFSDWEDRSGKHFATTAPHAICLAALKAVGYEFEEKL